MRSAENGERPAHRRCTTTMPVSRSGNPSNSKGRPGFSARSHRSIRKIVRTAVVNPRNWLPASPMNTDAGWVL